MLLEHGHAGRDVARIDPVVVRQPHEPRAARGIEHGPEVPLCPDVDIVPQHLESPVGCGHRLAERGCAVRGGVVRYDDFHLDSLLCECRLQRALE
jgi:hypothetical protein